VLYTGDLFRTDEEGFLYFVGRKDDIIKTRGEKVAPKEVETVLHAHPGIAEAVVIGLPDPVLGQAIGAIVVLSDPALTDREIIKHCAAHLEDFMVPQASSSFATNYRRQIPARSAAGWPPKHWRLPNEHAQHRYISRILGSNAGTRSGQGNRQDHRSACVSS
jgi:acyl-CoA synthetase (AMP-forming)/AMP-acid ligase II